MSWGLAMPETWGEYAALWVFATLILTLLRGRLSPLRGLATAYRWPLLGVLLAVGLVPLDGLYLAGYPRGVWGDLSVGSLLLLGIAALRPVALSMSWLAPLPRSSWALIALTGTLFYVGALGTTTFDPYSLGYRPGLVLIGPAVVAVLAVWLGALRLGVILTLGVLAHTLGLGESTNLWDYLLDAPLVLAAWLLWLGGQGRPASAPAMLT